jgi:hypothetical protein
MIVKGAKPDDLLVEEPTKMYGVLALLVVIAAVGCSSAGDLSAPTTSAIPQSDCGGTPGVGRSTWRPQLNYCE